MTEELRTLLDKPIKENSQLKKVAETLGLDVDQATIREMLLVATLVHGMKGTAPILQHIWDRLDGKVADRFAGHDGGPLAQDTLSRVITDPAMKAARDLARKLHGEPKDGEGV